MVFNLLPMWVFFVLMNWCVFSHAPPFTGNGADFLFDILGQKPYSIDRIECLTGNNSGELMKSYRKELWFQTAQRRELINITPQVEQAVEESGITEGLCLVNAMHITSSVFINDDEPGLHHDFEVWLEKLAPEKPYEQYRHNTCEDNADAHLKRTIMEREVVAAVTKGKLDFGPWEQIFYGEFDGRRRKRALIKIIGE